MDYSNIILEMLNRIQSLEKEVALLKQNRSETNIQTRATDSTLSSSHSKRDTTRFIFEGNVYLKNRLVLAVVKAYVRDHPNVSRNELKSLFSKSLQGSIGTVELAEIAQLRPDYTVRFFTKDEEILHLDDGDMYVCTQWGFLNIPNFIKRATQFGYNIEAI